MKALKIKEVSYHRNGISGEGFHVVTFRWKDDSITRRMIATVFDKPGRLAVFDTDQLNIENIAFANGNSWRGDDFEPQLRRAIKAWDNRPFDVVAKERL